MYTCTITRACMQVDRKLHRQQALDVTPSHEKLRCTNQAMFLFSVLTFFNFFFFFLFLQFSYFQFRPAPINSKIQYWYFVQTRKAHAAKSLCECDLPPSTWTALFIHAILRPPREDVSWLARVALQSMAAPAHLSFTTGTMTSCVMSSEKIVYASRATCWHSVFAPVNVESMCGADAWGEL